MCQNSTINIRKKLTLVRFYTTIVINNYCLFIDVHSVHDVDACETPTWHFKHFSLEWNNKYLTHNTHHFIHFQEPIKSFYILKNALQHEMRSNMCVCVQTVNVDVRCHLNVTNWFGMTYKNLRFVQHKNCQNVGTDRINII